ncbi:MAG: hypothetical protein ACRC6I_20900 [Paracoccaceae bacterium]
MHDCLAAVTYGALLPDGEFATVMGFTKAEARDALADWAVPPTGQSFAVARMAMVNIMGYPHGAGDQLAALTGWTAADIQWAWQDCFGNGDETV